LSDRYCYLLLAWPGWNRLAADSSIGLTNMYVQFWAPDDGRKTRLKHVEHLTEIDCEMLHLVGYTLRRTGQVVNRRTLSFISIQP